MHASGLGVEGIRQHCEDLSDKYETPFHMAGYAMVEALRDQNVEKVALNACYIVTAGIKALLAFSKKRALMWWAGNFHDQDGLKAKRMLIIASGALMKNYFGIFDYVADKAPHVDAYLINGMSNYRRPSDGLARRPVHHTDELESRLGKIVVGHDTALYWRLFKL